MSESSPHPFEPFIEAIAEAVAKKVAARRSTDETEDRLLTVEETAKMLSVAPDWLYRHAKRLPFTRKLGPKMLRFSY
jgi:predicted DNA-binding transcriptional regulator AlpA